MRQCRQLYAQGNALARRVHICSDNVKVTLFRTYCSSLYTSQLWWKYRVNSIRKLYVAYNNAFRMLFRLPRDCSASDMFAVNNVMSCPAVVRKLVFGFYKRVNSSQNCIVQAICGSDIWWKSLIRSNWRKLLYVHNAGQGIGWESDTQAVARFINCVVFAFYYYAVTYIIIINVLWTEGVSEINYWIELNYSLSSGHTTHSTVQVYLLFTLYIMCFICLFDCIVMW